MVQANAFAHPAVKPRESYLFEVLSRIYHGCGGGGGANVTKTFKEDAEDVMTAVVVASRNISQGEQLLIDYGVKVEWSKKQRQDWLQTKYGLGAHASFALARRLMNTARMVLNTWGRARCDNL